MTTLVVYPDADPESTTIDGRIQRHGVDQTFSAIIAGSGTSNSSTSASEAVGQLNASTTSNQFSLLRRAIFLFDTSSIPAEATVSDRTLSLYGVTKSDGLGQPDLDVVSSSPASNTALVNADFTTLGSTVYGSIGYASYSDAGYNDISLSGGVTLAGITKLGTRLSWDTDGSFGGTWSASAYTYMNCYFADQTGTTNDPKLTVVYTTGIDVTGTVLDAAGTVLDPAARIDYAAVAAALDAALTVLDPTASITFGVGPGVLDAALTVLDPTTHIVYAAFASVLDAALTVLDPTATVMITPFSWTLGDVSLMTATVTVDLLGEFDGLAGRRGENAASMGREGRMWGEKQVDERVIPLTLSIRATTREDYQAAVDALLAALGRSTTQVLRRGMADGSERLIDVKMARGVTVQPLSEKAGRLAVEFVAAHPFWYARTTDAASISGASALPDDIEIDNEGTAADLKAVITLTPSGGTVTNPRVTIGDYWVQYTGVVGDGETLTVDCGTYEASVDATDVAADMSSARAVWLRVEPGANTATVSGTLSAGTVTATLTYRRRWNR